MRRAPYGPVPDVATTMLQLAGLIVILAALFYLASGADAHRVRRFLLAGLVLLAWSAFLVAVGIGIRQFGIATSFQTTHWALTGGALAAFVLLMWISWLVFRREAPPPARNARLNLAALSLTGILLAGGYLGHIYQGRREAALRTLGIDFEKELESLRHGIVEGERIGPAQLGMSLDEVNGLIGRRFSSGERQANGLSSYVWRPLDDHNDFWNAFFEAGAGKAVIIGYGFWIVPSSSSVLQVAAQREIGGSRFQTAKGARFGDTRATIEALYGKPASVTRLEDRYDAATLRLHYPSMRTEFQLGQDPYGLLSILVYAPGFSPESALRRK